MATLAQELKPKRLYQVWKGNNRFFCGGRFMFGPDAASLLLSVLLIVGPTVTFCYQILTKIKHNKRVAVPVLVLTLAATVFDLVALLMTSIRDPGIVPRNSRPPEAEESSFNGAAATPSMEWTGRTPRMRLPRTKDVMVDGFAVKVKYCETCMVYRPPRASHCAICNNCVQKFDHHCPWLGQCIGLRNYRFFLLFIGTSTFLCVFVFVFSWLNIIVEKSHYHGSIIKTMKAQLLSLVLMLYTFVLFWFVGGLTAFHLYLIATNQTTYENFRYRYDKKENPYNRGYLRNLRDVFSSKIPPSMHDFRSWVLEETPPSTPNIRVVDVISRAEMGSEEPVTDAIPPLLRNLDYNKIEEGEDVKFRNEADSSGVLDYPVAHSPRSSIDSLQSYRGDNGGSTEETAGEEVDESENYSKEYSIAAHTNEGLAEEFQSKVAFAEQGKI
ncbi:probable protein S-acyltransferase 1 [Zingiber officinale]|uniref:probable protein S-acyltransferase 1 n=1 Tax=Zingiber officinale TaxID=94328 RepID=UPI001C4C61B0|nr:probable protein S-acyltransferase 1 [Zingiber officinale]